MSLGLPLFMIDLYCVPYLDAVDFAFSDCEVSCPEFDTDGDFVIDFESFLSELQEDV